VTTADTATPRPSVWGRFTAWRRSRPFWGGIVAILAGAEIYATSQQSPLGDMQIKIGPGGMAAYVIPLILIAAGVLAWVTPAQRLFYGIVVPAVSVYALIEINFGGWFIGTILGMIGGALIFAWTPRAVDPVPAEVGEPGPDTSETADDDRLPRHAAIDELLGEPQRDPGGTSGRAFTIAIVPLLLVAGIIAAKGTGTAYAAAPCRPATSNALIKPAKSATTKAVKAAPTRTVAAARSAQSSASPSSSPSPEDGLVGTIVGGIVKALDPSDSPSATPAAPEPSTPAAPKPSMSAVQPRPSTSPAAPAPAKSSSAPRPSTKRSPSVSATPCASPSPTPSAKRLRADVGQPAVTAKPSRMTGSSITMTGLAFEGVVSLSTADGPIDVLKFTMYEAVTDDFVLQTFARGADAKDVVFRSQKLTVRQTDARVVFYTNRFQGNLGGLLPVDYTPDPLHLPPLPPGIPVPAPLTFTDADIQLVWVDADVLTGTPSLTSTLA
jgi:hypothetical protein